MERSEDLRQVSLGGFLFSAAVISLCFAAVLYLAPFAYALSDMRPIQLLARGRVEVSSPKMRPAKFVANCLATGGTIDDCMGKTMLTGFALTTVGNSEADIAQGGRYIAYVAEMFTEIVRQALALGDPRKLHQVLLDQNRTIKEMPSSRFLDLPPTAMAALNDYFKTIWLELPAAPQSGPSFLAKFYAFEWLKELAIAGSGTPLTTKAHEQFYRGALAFLKDAFSFHQLPMPVDALGRTDDTYLEASVVSDLVYFGIGYARFPGREGLHPVRLLAETDLRLSMELVKRAAEGGLIDEDEGRSFITEIEVQRWRLVIGDLEYWLRQAQETGNKLETIHRLQDLINAHIELKELDEVARLRAAMIAELRDIGEDTELLAQTTELVSYELQQEQWEQALKRVNTVLPSMFDRVTDLNFWLLHKAIEQEQTALKALEREDEAARILTRRNAQVHERKKAWKMFRAAVDYASPARSRANLEKLIIQVDASPVLAVKFWITLAQELGKSFAGLSAEERAWDLKTLETYTNLVRIILPAVRQHFGAQYEVNLTRNLLEIYRRRAHLGYYVTTYDEFAVAAHKVYGRQWLAEPGRTASRVFYQLEEYGRAEAALRAAMQRDRLSLLFEKSFFRIHKLRNVEVNDLLFLGQIQLGQRRRTQALETIAQITERAKAVVETGTVDSDKFRRNLEVLTDAAQLEAAAGRPGLALELLELVLDKVEAAEDLGHWIALATRIGELRLQLGKSQADFVERLTQIVDYVWEFPEFDPAIAIPGDIFLGRYYAAKQADQARARLQRALAAAEKSGNLDQQITIQRELGNIARAQGQLDVAIQRYRTSINLLRKVSHELPSETTKLGYREDRTLAIPLLVLTLHDLYRQNGDPAYLEQMLGAVEEGKSRALTEVMLKKELEADVSYLDLSKLRAALPHDVAIIEYFVPEPVDDTVFRFYLDRETLRLDSLEMSKAALEAFVLELRKTVVRDRDFHGVTFRSKSHKLAVDLLPSDLMANSNSTLRRLYIVPTGGLHLFPFSLLVDDDGRYFNMRKNLSIAYLPNTSILLRKRAASSGARRMTAFINPALDRDHHYILRERLNLRPDLETALKRRGDTTIIWEERRTPSELLFEARKSDDVFIYAHARFLPENPMESHIRLAGNLTEDPELTAAEIRKERLGSGLWTIVGCSTGSGKIRSGDEVLGLPRALLQTGVSNVVVSLWDVDAVSSMQMMINFYHAMADGKSLTEALRTARENLRKDGKPPFDWAPFIVVGYHDFKAKQ